MALILHIPVLHEGYLKLFNRRKSEKTVYVLGEEIIKEYPLLAREIRRINPRIIVKLIQSLKLFDEVVLLTPNILKDLSEIDCVSADEVEMREFFKKYLPKVKVKYDSAFLRWDSQTATKQEVVDSDLIISKKEFDRKIMNQAIEIAENSADWFRQVGSVLVGKNVVLVSGFNRRQPSPHSAYTEGDPRNFFELGTDTHLRNTLHAEQDVISQAAKKGIKTEGSSIYVTTFPCPDCAALIAASGISKCYYKDGYSQLDGQKILKLAGVKIIKVN